MAIIKTNKLTKYYGEARGIVDLNLEVAEGDIFGFIGPNGAGKSTTIRTLLGLIKATSGEAQIFGQDIKTNKVDILKKIGYMPSEANFYPDMRVSDIIKLTQKLHGTASSDEAKRLCERFDLDCNKKIAELSLGNRKKVGIVCAFAHQPNLYILDEPTSGLDPLMQNEFLMLLQERNKAGATIFLSSHNLAEVQSICTKAAIIKDGQIIVCDKIENFAKSNAKHIVLYGVNQIPEIPGTKIVETSDKSITFLYQGPIKELLKAIDNLSYSDLLINDPSLEEIFMHYYQKGDK